MRELDDIRSDVISRLESVKEEMERAGVSATSEGNMTEEDFSGIQARVSHEIGEISDELGQMLSEQG